MARPSVIVIGGGIAGASAAWALADDHDVVLVERERAVGFHATGRSASVLNQTAGHPVVCALAAASRQFLRTPPDDFAEQPLLSPRGLLWVGAADAAAALDGLASATTDATGVTVHRLTAEQTAAVLPCARLHAIAGGGVWEPEAMSIDTDALLQSYVRGIRRRGGRVLTGFEISALRRDGNRWIVDGTEPLSAAHIVDAAGAWGDAVAALAGVPGLGLQPMRRTACIASISTVDPSWPLTMEVTGRYYFEPESGGLLVSPADETPSDPCDAQPEEVDVAIALDRLREATTLPVHGIRRAWAGLRTFAPDRAPVVGESAAAPGFWWLVGQGGGGIKTAPAMAMVLSALIRGHDVPPEVARHGVSAAALSPRRLSA